MPCRVGITTNPDRRKKEWRKQVIGFGNWKILERCNSREKAQASEDKYAKELGCEAHHGGEEAPGIWSVYYFKFYRER